MEYKYLSIRRAQEHTSFGLSKQINEKCKELGVLLLSSHVWDTETKQVQDREDVEFPGKQEMRYLPALTDAELASLLPVHFATMRVHHKDYGGNLFLCDHVSSIRYGANREQDEFHFEEVEVRGRKLLALLVDKNPDLMKWISQ